MGDDKMKNKIIYIAVILLTAIICALCVCAFNVKNNADAKKFKEEYESLNGTANDNGLEHRTVTIDENNPYVYSSGEEILEMIKNKEINVNNFISHIISPKDIQKAYTGLLDKKDKYNCEIIDWSK